MKKVLMISVPEEIYQDAVEWSRLNGFHNVEENLGSVLELHTWLYKMATLPAEEANRIVSTANLMLETGCGRRSLVNFIRAEFLKASSRWRENLC